MSPNYRCEGDVFGFRGAHTRFRRIRECEVVSSINAGVGYPRLGQT